MASPRPTECAVDCVRNSQAPSNPESIIPIAIRITGAASPARPNATPLFIKATRLKPGNTAMTLPGPTKPCVAALDSWSSTNVAGMMASAAFFADAGVILFSFFSRVLGVGLLCSRCAAARGQQAPTTHEKLVSRSGNGRMLVQCYKPPISPLPRERKNPTECL